ncbi:MAG: GNAT family N-acetyltransferase [Anaerolineales bacterium]|nr:GNAT family N-acetyltransferase [Anaerolineales bacterium]
MTPVIETERLALRRATLADAPFLLDLWNQPSYIQHIRDWGARTVAQAEALLQERILASYRLNGFGQFVVTLKAGGAPIGLCGLIRRAGLEDVDVGYAFLPQHWGNGYALEAAQACVRYGLTTLGLRRVVAIVSPGNERSIRLLEKLGLRYEKTITLPGIDEALKLFTPPGAPVAGDAPAT